MSRSEEWPPDEFDDIENSPGGEWLNAAALCSAVAHGVTLEEAADSMGYGQRGSSWRAALKMLQIVEPMEAEARCMTQYRQWPIGSRATRWAQQSKVQT